MSALLVVSLVLLPLVGAFIAWVGTVIQERLSASRHSLFGQTPRTTARMIAVAVGIEVPLIVLGLGMLGSALVRRVLFSAAAAPVTTTAMQWLHEHLFHIALVLIVALVWTRLGHVLIALRIETLSRIAAYLSLLPLVGRAMLYDRYRKRLRRDPSLEAARTVYVDLPFELQNPQRPSDREAAARGGLISNVASLLADEGCSGRVVWVAGEGGMGKTMLVSRLALECLEDHGLPSALRGRTPVVVPLIAFTGDLLGAIAQALRRHRCFVDETMVSIQLAAGALLVLIDGASEVRDTGDQEKLIEGLNDLVSRFPNSSYLVTSRAMPDPAVRDVYRVVRLRRPVGRYLAPFLGSHMARARAGAERRVQNLIAEMKTRLDEIPSVPLLLKLIATIYAEQRRLPTTRAGLFRQYTELLLSDEKGGLTELAGEFALQQLAYSAMVVGDGLRSFSDQFVVRCLGAIDAELVNRGVELPSVVIFRLLRGAGLLIESGGDWRFFHDAAQDYFLARYLEDQLSFGEGARVRRALSVRGMEGVRAFLLDMLEHRHTADTAFGGILAHLRGN